jgi:BirA family biotin operon repressor/biotin-[acetyl-CoA-carboxylase] ligase
MRGTFRPKELKAAVKPYRLYFFPRLRSTNDYAALLRKKGKLFAPAIVLTANQIAGRGRGPNTWWSSRDVLTVTFAFPIEERLSPHELPLIAGLVVRQVAADLTGHSGIELKWPNDVLHEGKKLAGLLCERVNKVDLVGIGLNVNVDPASAPPELRSRVTSLLAIGAKPLDMNIVVAALAKGLHHAMRRRMEKPFSVFVREYEEHDALAGKIISVLPAPGEAAVAGRCEGIDEMGRLLIRNRKGLQPVMAGQVIVEGK